MTCLSYSLIPTSFYLYNRVVNKVENIWLEWTNAINGSMRLSSKVRPRAGYNPWSQYPWFRNEKYHPAHYVVLCWCDPFVQIDLIMISSSSWSPRRAAEGTALTSSHGISSQQRPCCLLAKSLRAAAAELLTVSARGRGASRGGASWRVCLWVARWTAAASMTGGTTRQN